YIIYVIVLHILFTQWLKKKHKPALYEALEKVKTELMLMGFISFLLTVLKDSIANICISETVADTWHPCDKHSKAKSPSKETDKCRKKACPFIFLLFFNYSHLI
ncbi:hypothetical protein Golob_006524, partial [Gossypium lobatum]|nr:hypothetical protein [Gossypium lobatum]